MFGKHADKPGKHAGSKFQQQLHGMDLLMFQERKQLTPLAMPGSSKRPPDRESPQPGRFGLPNALATIAWVSKKRDARQAKMAIQGTN